jgi:hypothetical protein
MAAAAISGATVARTSEHDAQLGALMGKQEAAQILVAYTVQSGVDPESVKAEAVAQAQAAGWDIADSAEDVVQGTKRLETGDATIGIAFVDEDGEERLIVRLAHEFNHPTSRDG